MSIRSQFVKQAGSLLPQMGQRAGSLGAATFTRGISQSTKNSATELGNGVLRTVATLTTIGATGYAAASGLEKFKSSFPSTLNQELADIEKKIDGVKIGYFGAGSDVTLDPNRELYFAPEDPKQAYISQGYAKADARRKNQAAANSGSEEKFAPILNILVADREIKETDLEVSRSDETVNKLTTSKKLDGAVPYRPISPAAQKDMNLRVGASLPVTPENDDTFLGHVNRAKEHFFGKKQDN